MRIFTFASVLTTMTVATLCTAPLSARTAKPPEAQPPKRPEPPPPNPKDPVDYIAWYNETFGKNIPDDQNAATLHNQAHEKLKPLEGEWGQWHRQPWKDDPRITQWLELNQEAMKLFKEGARRKACFFELKSWEDAPERFKGAVFGAPLRHISHHREIARGIAAEGHRAIATEDYALAGRDAIILVRAGHQLMQGTGLIDYLLGASLADLGHDLILDLLAADTAPIELIKSFQSQLKEIDPPLPSLHTAFMLERIGLQDFLQRIFIPTDDDGIYTLHNLKGTGLEHMLDIGVLGRMKIVSVGYEKHRSLADAHYDKLDRWLDQPLPSALKPKSIENANEIESSELLLVAFVPSLARTRGLTERVEITRQATHLILELHRIRHEKGVFPKSLEGIKPATLDPYSGKPLRYQRTEDGFLLYSIGADFDDDGGQRDIHWAEDKSGDYVFWPRPE